MGDPSRGAPINHRGDVRAGRTTTPERRTAQRSAPYCMKLPAEGLNVRCASTVCRCSTFKAPRLRAALDSWPPFLMSQPADVGHRRSALGLAQCVGDLLVGKSLALHGPLLPLLCRTSEVSLVRERTSLNALDSKDRAFCSAAPIAWCVANAHARVAPWRLSPSLESQSDRRSISASVVRQRRGTDREWPSIKSVGNGHKGGL
jgi:hypothetical protein